MTLPSLDGRCRSQLRQSRCALTMLVLGAGLAWVPAARAATVRAATCSAADVQNAIDGAQTGDTVLLPPGTCTWGAAGDYTPAVSTDKSLTIQGNGTTLVASGPYAMLSVNVSAANTGRVRITGLTFRGALDQATGIAFLLLDGYIAPLIVEHNAFLEANNGRDILIGYRSVRSPAPAIEGVVSHNTVSNSSYGHQFALINGKESAWQQPDDYGTEHAIYLEDNTGAWSSAVHDSNSLTDGEHGARIVARYNTLTNGMLPVHDSGSTQESRGTRLFEVYGNVQTCTIADCHAGVTMRGGSGFIFDNVIHSGYSLGIGAMVYRAAQTGGHPWANRCDATPDNICSDFRSHCSGGARGPCFGDYDCTGTSSGTCVVTQPSCTADTDCGAGVQCLIGKLDGQRDASGWPCRDQVGTGRDLSDWTQEQRPFYIWNNVDEQQQNVSAVMWPQYTNYLEPDRDYYDYASAFDGTSGVGRGATANRPASCATGVAYWSTDEQALYRCSASNDWELYYQPHVYPHPLACVPVTEVCDDGLDNDCDGLLDGMDPDCGRSASTGGCSYRAGEAGGLGLLLAVLAVLAWRGRRQAVR